MPKALTGERVFLCLQIKPSQPSKNLGVFKCWEKRAVWQPSWDKFSLLSLSLVRVWVTVELFLLCNENWFNQSASK